MRKYITKTDGTVEQFRFPRSKKGRIRCKWEMRSENWREVSPEKQGLNLVEEWVKSLSGPGTPIFIDSFSHAHFIPFVEERPNRNGDIIVARAMRQMVDAFGAQGVRVTSSPAAVYQDPFPTDEESVGGRPVFLDMPPFELRRRNEAPTPRQITGTLRIKRRIERDVRFVCEAHIPMPTPEEERHFQRETMERLDPLLVASTSGVEGPTFKEIIESMRRSGILGDATTNKISSNERKQNNAREIE